MTVAEFIKKLQKLPQDLTVKSYNETYDEFRDLSFEKDMYIVDDLDGNQLSFCISFY